MGGSTAARIGPPNAVQLPLEQPSRGGSPKRDNFPETHQSQRSAAHAWGALAGPRSQWWVDVGPCAARREPRLPHRLSGWRAPVQARLRSDLRTKKGARISAIDLYLYLLFEHHFVMPISEVPKDICRIVILDCRDVFCALNDTAPRRSRRMLNSLLRQADERVFPLLPDWIKGWADRNAGAIDDSRSLLLAMASHRDAVDAQVFEHWVAELRRKVDDRAVATLLASVVVFTPERLEIGELQGDQPPLDNDAESTGLAVGAIAPTTLPLPWSGFLSELAALPWNDPAWQSVDVFYNALAVLMLEKERSADEHARLTLVIEQMHQFAADLAFLEHGDLLKRLDAFRVSAPSHVPGLLRALVTNLEVRRVAESRLAKAATRAERDAAHAELAATEREIDLAVVALGEGYPSIAGAPTADVGSPAEDPIPAQVLDHSGSGGGYVVAELREQPEPLEAPVPAVERASEAGPANTEDPEPASAETMQAPLASPHREDLNVPAEALQSVVTEVAEVVAPEVPVEDRGQPSVALEMPNESGADSEGARAPVALGSETVGGHDKVTVTRAPATPVKLARSPDGHLGEVLRTLDDYVSQNWVRGDGTVVPAPWVETGFGARLLEAIEAELTTRSPSFGRLAVFAAASLRTDIGGLSVRDVEDCARYWTGGSAEPDETRTERIYASFAGDEPPSRAGSVRALLAALQPGPTPLTREHVEGLIKRLDVGADMGAALRELFALGIRRKDSLHLLRTLARNATLPSREAIEAQLKKAREHLRAVHTELTKPTWIKTTFCRKAWQEFMEVISPRLAPALARTDQPISAPDALPDGPAIEQAHAKNADAAGARFEDRARMDRRVTELAVAINNVRELGISLITKANPERERLDTVLDFVALQRAVQQPGNGEFDFLRELLGRAIHLIPAEGCAEGLTTEDIVTAPDVLLALGRDETGPARPLPWSAFERTLYAAAALLDAPNAPVRGSKLLGPKDLLAALENSRRLAVGSRIASWLDPAARGVVQRAADEVRGSAERRLAELRQVVARLAGAGSLAATEMRNVITIGEQMIEAPERRLIEIHAWLDAVNEHGLALLDYERTRMLADASRDGSATLTAVAALLDEGRFDRASAVLRGGASVDLNRRHRACAWRDEAEARYPKPRTSMLSVEDAGVQQLLERWFDAPTGSSATGPSRARRTSFARYLLNKAYEEPGVDRSKQTSITVQMSFVTRLLADRGFEPTFLPQLRQFDNLVIPELPHPKARTFVVDAARVASQQSRDLVVLLAPELSAERRTEVLRELRQRKAAGVVIDDLDLCRIVSPGFTAPDPLLAMLEIGMEQLEWNQRSPFRAARVEGQAVLREMYVGRADEARELALSATYTRVFSGRKLGKSALLRFVEHTYDGQRLPSGNVLRVVYVPAVGTYDEQAMVGTILDAARAKLGDSFVEASSSNLPAADRLWAALKRRLEEHPRESLLLVLDEADAFVEHQIAEAKRRLHAREEVLSFAMRSRMQSVVDGRGLPRVRFVFTGYRATHRDEGAWANWGFALHLKPLPPEEAARLISGPLARVGVDASEQAEVIAHRCGYQPAVLLIFAEHLLQRLASRVAPESRVRKTTVVTPEDVASVNDLDAVRYEIELIARNNFDGNPLGLVIFGAVLATFLDLGSTAEVEDLGERVAERLLEFTGDGSVPAWLGGDEGSLSRTVERALSDLVQRQLLRERRQGQHVSHGLVFPHHLNVLLKLADRSYLAGLVRELAQHGITHPAGDESAWLSTGEVESIRAWCTRENEPPVLVPTITTLGGQSVWTRSRFVRAIHDALGFERARVLDAPTAPRPAGFPERCCILCVTDDDVQGLLAELGNERRVPLLIGGPELHRLASTEEEFPTPAGPVQLVALPLYRLPTSRARWWFEVARGLTFARAEDPTRLVDACAGMPALVAHADVLLTGADGAGAGRQVAATELEEVLRKLDAEVVELADRIHRRALGYTLSKRALEILRLIHVVDTSAPNAAIELDDLLEELWYLHAKQANVESIVSPLVTTDRADRLALEELQALGVLPSTISMKRGLPAERFAVVGRLDPVRTIARRIGLVGAP